MSLPLLCSDDTYTHWCLPVFLLTVKAWQAVFSRLETNTFGFRISFPVPLSGHLRIELDLPFSCVEGAADRGPTGSLGDGELQQEENKVEFRSSLIATFCEV